MNAQPSLRRSALSGRTSTGCLPGCTGGCAVIGTICTCIVVAVVAVIVGIVMKVVKSSDPYKDSIAAVQKNATAVEALGEPIEPKFLFSGKLNIKNGRGIVNMNIPIKGPKGTGVIEVIGIRASSSDHWNYSNWQLKLPDGKSIPLGQ